MRASARSVADVRRLMEVAHCEICANGHAPPRRRTSTHNVAQKSHSSHELLKASVLEWTNRLTHAEL